MSIIPDKYKFYISMLNNTYNCKKDRKTNVLRSEFSENQNYSANNFFAAKVNLDFFLDAVFLCKIPFETALSHN